ncbi:MAG: VIT domain-containing protein [Caulobacter sp.]
MRRVGIAIFAVALAWGAVALAGPAQNPSLTAKNYVGDRPDEPDALKLSRLKVDVVLVGGLARTTVEARLENTTQNRLEGDFALALPAGAVIDGYALDVDGRMVDGVLTGKRQAKEVYEARVREDVDPGLAEVADDGSFHTRIFPILPDAPRTIRLSYAAPLAADGAFSLPLVFGGTVGEVSLRVTIAGAAARPVVTAPAGLALAWSDGSEGAIATGAAKDAALDGALSVGAWRAASPLELSRHANGERFFELRLPYDVRAATVRSLRIYWDRSLSRRDDDLDGEIALLARYVDDARPAEVELVTFAADGTTATRLPAPTGAGLAAALRGVTYGGATSLEGVLAAGKGAADTCILASDGRMTLGAWSARPPACRTFTLSSAKDADRNFLSVLAMQGRGQHVDLTAVSPAAALARLTSAGAPAFSLTTSRGRAVEHRLVAGPTGRWQIIGKAPAADLVFTGPDGARLVFALKDRPVRAFDGTGALWGREAVAGLLASDRPDREAALALARRYNVATSEASFVVLEEAYDYVQAGVAPPASAGKDIVEAYREALAEQAKDDAEEAAERLDEMVEAWAEQKDWWARKPVRKGKRRWAPSAMFVPVPPPPPPSPPPPPPQPVITPPLGGDAPSEPVAAAPAPSPSPSPGPTYGAVSGGYYGDLTSGVEEVAVTGVHAAGPTIVIQAAEWNPDRPYLKILAEAGTPEAWAERFAALERTDGAAPAFYFDVAEQAFRAGRREQAIAVAANAVELPSSGVKTQNILADRLVRYGDLDRAIGLYERILFLEPDRPQPRRDLALALIARGETRKGAAREADWRRALELLNEVITRPWNSDYDGIEMVALMEANGLIARMARAGLSQHVLDRRLTGLLDVDIRVVMEWNTDHSDMDLWVDEPTGERAIYDNPETEAGGRLSNDMTEGYGPEEYLLRRAPEGEYVVQADVYAPDQLDPNGPTVVRVRLYRHWGRPNQAEERFEVELTAGQDGEAELGRFRVGPVAGGKRK